MKQLLQILIISLIITTCTPSNVNKYNSRIDRVSRIEIDFKNSDKKIELDKKQVEILKDILKRNIVPEYQRKFVTDIQIDLYDNENRIGFLMITDNSTKPFVNFGSNDLNFGFQLTYGIGQYLNEIKYKH
jgi:hypothetical protein